MKRLTAHVLIFLVAFSSSVGAQPPTPSPPDLAVESLGLVPGLFVHMRETSNPTFAPGSEVCLHRSGIRVMRDPHAPPNKEYWYYRAGDLQALFTRESVITFNRRCAPTIRDVRTAHIHRADGPLRTIDGAEAKWLHPLQSRIECAGENTRCSPTIIAGIASLCVSGGDGLISVSHCISDSDGPSRGMRMSQMVSDDVGGGFHRIVDVVDERAMIDLALFQRRETW